MSAPGPPTNLVCNTINLYNLIELYWYPSNDTNNYIVSFFTNESIFILKFMVTNQTNIYIPYLAELSKYGDTFIVNVCAVNNYGNSSSININIKFETNIPSGNTLPEPATDFTSINNTANFYWSGFNYSYFVRYGMVR